jgi:cell wall surface anchor family protein
LFAAAVLTTGCTKNDPGAGNVPGQPEETGGKRTLALTASTEAATRAVYDRDDAPGAEQYVRWEAGDEIYIGFTFFDADGRNVLDEYGYEATAAAVFTAAGVSADARTATFSGEVDIPAGAANVQCMAVYYPGGEHIGAYGTHVYIVNAPVVQQYRQGGFARLPMMAAGYHPVEAISLEFICPYSIIRIPVSGQNDVGMALNTVFFEGMNGEILGKDITFKIGESTAGVTGNTDDIDIQYDWGHSTSYHISVDCNGLTLSDAPVDIYIGIPVMAYPGGVRFTFIANNNTIIKKQALFPDGILQRNKIITVPGVKLAPNGFEQIPDPGFREFLYDHGYIDIDEAAGTVELTDLGQDLQDLSLYETSIISLKGIELFTNLTNLTLDGTKVSALDLGQNTALTEISVSGNMLSALDLTANARLTTIAVFEQALIELKLPDDCLASNFFIAANDMPVSEYLRKLPLLRNIELHDIQVNSIDFSGNPALEEARISSNSHAWDLNLSGCAGLKSLVINGLTYLDENSSTMDMSVWDSYSFTGFIMRNTTPTMFDKFVCTGNPYIKSIDISGSTFGGSVTITDNPRLGTVDTTGTTATGGIDVSNNGGEL